MAWVAAIAAGIGALSSRSAARQQRNAANEANRIQWEMFQQQRADQAPWREAGGRALNQLETLTRPDGELARDFTLNDYQADPGFQFRQQQGEQAINRNALARGRFNSGSVLKALQEYNSGLASQEYGAAFNRFMAQRDARFNRLAAVAGVGQTATNQSAAAAGNVGNAMAANVLAAGNAGAAARMGQANALAWGAGQAVNWWRSRPPAQAGGGSGGFNLWDYNSWADENN
jgi:hypothetical protein